MARDENPPFDRGHTWYDGETIDTNDLGGVNLEGKEWEFEDVSPTTGIARTNGRKVVCRCVRNVSGVNLLPKLCAQLSATAGVGSGRVTGHVAPTVTDTPTPGYPIDEYLPAAGVPTNDLFWIVMEGAAIVTTTVADMGADLAVGEYVVSGATGAASTYSTTSGRIIPQLLTGATARLAANIQHRIGRAMTAGSTTSTATDILVDVGHW